MRYLLLSDIHSNDEALAAVLARVRRSDFDRVVILGDFVGYGADPNAVLDRLRRIRKPQGRDPRQPRQGRLRARPREASSIPWRWRRPGGRREA